MSDLSAYGSSIQGLKEQAQSCRVNMIPLLTLLRPMQGKYDADAESSNH